MEKSSKVQGIAVIAVFVVLTIVLIALIPMEQKQLTLEKYGTLAVNAETDEKAAYILEHAEEYPPEILSLYNDFHRDSLYVDFIYNYPEHKDDYLKMAYTEEEMEPGTMPRLNMHDLRWCYGDIGGQYIYFSGCAAVALTMAYIDVFDKYDMDPVKVGDVAEGIGAIGLWGGIDVTRMKDVCICLGFIATEYRFDTEGAEPDEQLLKDIIDNGSVLLAGTHGSVFGDHAIIIRSYTEDGFMINDPASDENSEKTWTFEELKDELYYVWELR